MSNQPSAGPLPVLLCLEMAFTDYKLGGEQSSPSWLEIIEFDSLEEANAVEDALSLYVNDRYPDHVHLWWFYQPLRAGKGSLEVAKALVDRMMKDFSEPCICETAGLFHSGVPGILAKIENGKLVPGTTVNRCEVCKRYETDLAALAKLIELGIAPAGYRRFEVSVESRRKLTEEAWAENPQQAKQLVHERTAEGAMNWNDAETLQVIVSDANEAQPGQLEVPGTKPPRSV